MATRALVGLALVAGVEGQARLQGELKSCKDGRQHTVTYDVKQKINDEEIIALSNVTNLTAVQCDLDGSMSQLTFANEQAGAAFCASLSAGKYVVGGKQFGCRNAGTGVGGVMLKRALKCEPDTVDKTKLILHGAPLQYSEVYETMNVKFHSTPSEECVAHERRLQFPTCPPDQWCCQDPKTAKYACLPCKHLIFGHCNDLDGSDQTETCSAEGMMGGDNCVAPGPTPIPGPDHEKLVCLGVNMDPTTCTSAKAPIPLYTNSVLDISCDKCFAGFTTDVFFNINLDGGFLHEIQAGFRKTGVHAGLEVAVDATKTWSVGIDKDIWKAGSAGAPLIHFNIGPIPFLVWFETSGHFKADLTSVATAHTKLGVFGDYNVGDNYVSWDMQRHWQYISSVPTFTHSLAYDAPTASVKTHADVSMTTMIAMHLDQVFTSTLTFAPGAQMDLNGFASVNNKPQVCEDASYDAKLALAMQLHVDLPFHLMDINKQWNKDLWDRQGAIPRTCQNISIPSLEVVV